MRKTILFLQFALIFMIINPMIYIVLGSSHDTFDLQRVTEWWVFGLSLLIVLIDKPLRLQILGLLQSIASYKRLLLALIFALGIVSSIHALYPTYALLEVMSFFCLFVSSLVFAGIFSLDKEQYFQQFRFFLLLSLTVSSLLAFMTWLLYFNHPQALMGNAANQLSSPGYMNRRFYDDVQCMAIPFFISFVAAKEGALSLRVLSFLIVSYCYARGLMGGSRIYYYETALFTVLFPLLYRRAALHFLLIQFAAIAIGIALYFLLYAHAHHDDYAFSLTYLNHRAQLWLIASMLTLKHPFLGVGPMHFGLYAYPIEITAAHPHNMLLFIASQWGLPVLLCVLFLILGLRPVDCGHPLRSMSILGSLLVGLLMMQADDLMQMPAGQMMLMLVLGLHLAYAQGRAPQITQKALSVSIQYLFLPLGLLSFLGILIIGIPLFMGADLSIFRFLNACSFNCLVAPNYWSQGFIQLY